MAAEVTAPFNYFEDITTSDTVDIQAFTREGRLTEAIYVGVGGTVVVFSQSLKSQSFVGVPAGSMLRVAARRVGASSTASSLQACFTV